MSSSPKPTINYLDDLDCFNDFKNEFPAIVYNDGLTSKPDLEIEPLIWFLYLLHIRDTHGSGTRYGSFTSFILETPMAQDGSDRVIPDKGDLRDNWIEISSDRDFLGLTPSYVLIRDPVRRLCHRMIAYSIFGRGQALEKVVTCELPLIDLHKLRRLIICSRFGDTWAWVALGPKRQQDAAAGAHDADEAGLAVEEGAQDIPAPVQAPQPPSPAFDSTLVGSSRMPYQRRIRPRTCDAITSAAPHTDDQPDP
ncbi:hypothetical protein Tco_1260833 [Tanacetum coccineum]